jgi:hypothetical protein
MPTHRQKAQIFCDRAQAVGVRVDLEFIPHFGIRTLSDAWNVVREANRYPRD